MHEHKEFSDRQFIWGTHYHVLCKFSNHQLFELPRLPPFWGGPLLTVWFYKHLTGTVTMKQALYVGLLTGSLAGIFGFLFVMVQMAGAGLMLQLDQYLPPDQVPYMFMGPTALIFKLVVVIISIICGLIGGLVGGAIWQDKAPAATIPNQ